MLSPSGSGRGSLMSFWARQVRGNSANRIKTRGGELELEDRGGVVGRPDRPPGRGWRLICGDLRKRASAAGTVL